MVKLFKTEDIIDNRYLVKGDIGEGGFGNVLSVLDQYNNNLVALKYCTSNSEEDIRRFKREVRIMENIDHENVISVLSSNVEYNPPYFTMPKALYPVIKIIPSLEGNISKVIPIFESICKGINAIHISDHTHRDIKPDNALVLEDGKIVVSDLGLAKLDYRDTTVLTGASTQMGTYHYMPPEQFTYGGTRDFDHRGDMYQLGKTLYELLTGHRPIVMNNTAVPTGIWYVIQKATRQNPEERYQSVGQLLDALQDTVRASDPAMDPYGALEELINIAEANIQINQYNLDNVTKILQLIYSTEDQDDYIQFFHIIPEKILQVYASVMPTEFDPIIEKYNRAIDEKIGGYQFAFAETIASKMGIIVNNTNSPEVKRYAIISVLIAANRLNRWAAMGEFDVLLQNLKNDSDAYAVADGLRERIYDYQKIYDRIPKKELHPAIQVVWESCERNTHS